LNRRTFERLVKQAVDSIPAEFLGRIENLSFQVETWADDETLAEVGMEDARDLLGFYRGWPLSERTHDYGSCLPDVIVIYQGAVANQVLETGQSYVRVIGETVIHELAHYFGFTEEELDAVEALWADGKPGDKT
jgi:predicted Zn-dependent protease with MMP-like domain